MAWIRSDMGLGLEAGTQWINGHVATFVNLAGPLLGTAKATTSVLSGEMRDTAELNQAMNLLKVGGGVHSAATCALAHAHCAHLHRTTPCKGQAALPAHTCSFNVRR